MRNLLRIEWWPTIWHVFGCSCDSVTFGIVAVVQPLKICSFRQPFGLPKCVPAFPSQVWSWSIQTFKPCTNRQGSSRWSKTCRANTVFPTSRSNSSVSIATVKHLFKNNHFWCPCFLQDVAATGGLWAMLRFCSPRDKYEVDIFSVPKILQVALRWGVSPKWGST